MCTVQRSFIRSTYVCSAQHEPANATRQRQACSDDCDYHDDYAHYGTVLAARAQTMLLAGTPPARPAVPKTKDRTYPTSSSGC